MDFKKDFRKHRQNSSIQNSQYLWNAKKNKSFKISSYQLKSASNFNHIHYDTNFGIQNNQHIDTILNNEIKVVL